MELKGKTLLFLGDSITEGTGVAHPANIYLNRLGRMTGAKCVLNFGVGGTSLARNRAPGWRTGAFVVRAQTLPEDAWQADAAFIFGGTNDYGIGDAAFGPENSCDPFEINGAVNIIVRTLRGMNPAMRIIFVTPLRRQGEAGQNPATGQPLSAYADLIIRAAQRHQAPCCDLFHAALFEPDDAEDRERCIPDGLHPNDEGHRRLAEALFEFISKLP